MKKTTNKKPSIGAMIAKIAFGLIFIMIGIMPDDEFDMGARSMSIIIGLALIAWAIAKYVSWHKQRDLIMHEIEREEQEINELKSALNNRARKCPHCGATSRGRVCEYCGSPLADE